MPTRTDTNIEDTLSMTHTIDSEEIAAWLCQNATPMGHVIGSDTHDLKPLERILNSVRIVGLAEATHGTREFIQIRHRLLRFLVVEMGFNALAIEASYSAAEVVNEYLLNGEGDRSSVVTGLGFVMWDVQEFCDILDWLVGYNKSVCDAQKVRFYGVDIWNTRVGRERVLAYLRIVAPERVSSMESLFQNIASGEARGMMLAHEQVEKESFLKLQGLAEFLITNRDTFIRRTSVDEFEHINMHVRVILQWVSSSLTDELSDELPPSTPRMSTLNNFARSRYMAENLLHMMERDRPDAKVVIWAHVFHLGIGFEDAAQGTIANMGQYLRERFGEEYYVFGLELGDGAYLARTWLPDNTLGDFKIGTIPVAPEGSLPWHLSKINTHSLMLDLRGRARTPAVEQWLTTPQVLHAASWCHRDPPRLYTKRAVTEVYDGIIFIAHTSATTPTGNALKTVSARAGY